jgi:hypothetical protein
VLVTLHGRGTVLLHTFGYQNEDCGREGRHGEGCWPLGRSAEMGRNGPRGCRRIDDCGVLHPSRETASTIIASEVGLVAAHVLYTLSWLLVLLGLPGLYLAQRGAIGRLGSVGFLTAFLGTYLIAVTGNFGFLAPVLAKQSPTVLDSIN